MKEYFLPTNVWILSKGRPSNMSSRLFSKWGIDHTIFVEPQDEEAYRAVLLPHARLHIISQNNCGISFVRNQMLETARSLGNVPYWMCDDDIKNIWPTTVISDKVRRLPGGSAVDAMDHIERECFAHPEIAFGAPAHVSNIWAQSKTDTKIDYPSFFINWIHPGRIHPDLRWIGHGLEDALFAGQMVMTGGRPAWILGAGVEVAPIGFSPSAGGMTEYYQKWDEKVIPACRRMEEYIERFRSFILERLPLGKERESVGRMKLVRWYNPKWAHYQDSITLRWSALRKLRLIADRHGIYMTPSS